eukprot:7145067-Pyramimonas_sp.AAC.1
MNRLRQASYTARSVPLVPYRLGAAGLIPLVPYHSLDRSSVHVPLVLYRLRCSSLLDTCCIDTIEFCMTTRSGARHHKNM